MLDRSSPDPAHDLRDRHGARASARSRLFYLHVPAALGHRHLQGHAELRRRRRAVPERQRHLPRRDDRPGRVGRADRRRRRRATCGSTASTPMPENVTATVKSVSAIGEQYIDLVPPDDAVATGCSRQRPTSTSDHTAIGQDIAGLLTQADSLVNSVGDSRTAGSAARDVQGVQRIRPRTGAADPVVAAAGRRGQRELRPDHPADRPGRPVPGRADPQRRRHQVAGRRPGAVHHRGRASRSAAAQPCCRPRPAPPRRPTPRSPASGPPSRCWPPTSPTSAGSASSTTSRSSRRW